MYTLKSAIGKPKNNQGRWVEIDLGAMLLPNVFSTYDKVLAVLTNNFLPNPVCLDLATIRRDYGSQNITFNQFLVNLGNASLDTTDQIPAQNTRYARYQDAFRAGYTVTAVHPTAAIDAEIPESEKTWIFLSRENTDFDLFYESCLVSVNGMIHATDGAENGVYVQHGMCTRDMTSYNQIGIHSFNGIGKLSFIPITEDMIYKQEPEQKYSDRAHIDLGVDVSDKTVMLVLGGYLHILDPKTFYRVGDSTFGISFANLPYIDRYYDSRKVIDLSSMNLSQSTFNDNQISVPELLSDEVIVKYLTLSQSFFVLLDKTDIFVEYEDIHTTKRPGMYISYSAPKFPLLTELGKMVNYWYVYEDGQYSVVTTDAFRDDPNYRTVSARDVNSVSNSRNAGCPRSNSSLHYLKIGADI